MDPQVWLFFTIQHHPSTQRIQKASSSAGAGALDPGAPQFHAPSADMQAEIWYALALLQVAGMLMMINHKETYYPWQSLEASNPANPVSLFEAMKPAHPKAATSPPSPPTGARTSAFTANIFGQLLRIDPRPARPLQQHERNPLSRQLLYFYAEFQLQTKNGAHMLRTHVDGSSWGRGALRKSSSGTLRAFSCEMLSW